MKTIDILFLILTIPALVVSLGIKFSVSAIRQWVKAGLRLGLIGLTTFSVLMMAGCGIPKSNPLHPENIEEAAKPGDDLLSCEQIRVEYYRTMEDIRIFSDALISGLTFGVKKHGSSVHQARLILLVDRYTEKSCYDPEKEFLIFGRFIIAPQPGSPEAQELLLGLSDADKSLSCEEIPSAIMEEKSAIAERKVSPIILSGYPGQPLGVGFKWPPPSYVSSFESSHRLQGLFALEQDKKCVVAKKIQSGVK